MAEKETDPKRKAELYKISEKRPRSPPTSPRPSGKRSRPCGPSSLLVVEENQTGMSTASTCTPKADIESGRMNDFEAFEVAGCMLMKSEMMWITSEAAPSFSPVTSPS